MTTTSVLLIFMQLCCFQMMLLSMPTCKLPGKVVQETHNLLRDLGGPFPVHCKRFKNKMLFPDSALSNGSTSHQQCHWTSLMVYESLQGAELMFIDYELPEGEGGVTWDEQKLDKYLNLQDQLVEDYQCLNSTEVSGIFSPYFSNVTAVVEQQDIAVCGWEKLRTDLLWVLKFALVNNHGCFNWTGAH